MSHQEKKDTQNQHILFKTAITYIQKFIQTSYRNKGASFYNRVATL